MSVAWSYTQALLIGVGSAVTTLVAFFTFLWRLIGPHFSRAVFRSLEEAPEKLRRIIDLEFAQESKDRQSAYSGIRETAAEFRHHREEWREWRVELKELMTDLQGLPTTVGRIDAELERQRENIHDLRNQIQQIVLRSDLESRGRRPPR